MTQRFLLAMAVLFLFGAPGRSESPRTIRVATYNISFYRNAAGELLQDLLRGTDPQAANIAEVLQRVRPDILVLNEIDFVAEGAVIKAFRNRYLEVSQAGLRPLRLERHFIAPVNTGESTLFDLDRDGKLGGPADCQGFGRYPGQYGMAILSRFSIDFQKSRTFQRLLWKTVPGARAPKWPSTGKPYYTEQEWASLRLPSKSFWDVVIEIPAKSGGNFPLHVLASHPTPPVFDGPEDRNGARNADEIRLIVDYLSPENATYFVDDQGRPGGLPTGERFVVLGDLNADPVDSEYAEGAISTLLRHSRVNAVHPASEGAVAASEKYPELNSRHQASPRFDTADFTDDGHGNLRVDYALPSQGLEVVASGVFWPVPGTPGADAITATDHRLIWVDLRLPQSSQ